MNATVRWLRDRADSYWRDAAAFQEEDEDGLALAYRAIADELRKCSALIEAGDLAV